MRAGILLVFFVGGCEADIGRPTVQAIVQDAGAPDAAAEAGPALTADGDACTADRECDSGHCFVGGMTSYCSRPCTPENAATACGNAPFNGVCNNRGLCRRP